MVDFSEKHMRFLVRQLRASVGNVPESAEKKDALMYVGELTDAIDLLFSPDAVPDHPRGRSRRKVGDAS